MSWNSSPNPVSLLGLTALVVSMGLAADVVAPNTASAAAMNLTAHRAVYELKLKDASEKSAIAQAKGRLVFELEGDNCVGYAVNMRIVTQFRTKSGRTNVIDSRSTAWEGPEGAEMSFGSKQLINAQVAEEVKGNARKGTASTPGNATFSKPEGSFELPAATVFPVEHTKRLIEAARNGTLMDRTLVFDGTELNKLFTAVSFIGRQKTLADVQLPDSLTDRKEFEGQAAWPITVSYYDKATGDAASEQIPSHEISFVMFENGVSTNLSLGYEHFSMQGDLSEITFFEPTQCKQ